MNQFDSHKEQASLQLETNDENEETVEESMSKFEWEHQYWHSHHEPEHAISFALIFICGLIILPFVVWILMPN